MKLNVSGELIKAGKHSLSFDQFMVTPVAQRHASRKFVINRNQPGQPSSYRFKNRRVILERSHPISVAGMNSKRMAGRKEAQNKSVELIRKKDISNYK